ncbi:MAG: AraC family transcriptional regulator [Bacilli bacterium]|nr:AraC family transcriptional regulator [Bacilli bacterium]
MNIEKNHALNEADLSQYDTVCPLESFSIAEIKEESIHVIPPFHHSHEAYEFILPELTIPALHYDKANYIGEVGYIYPVNPFTDHGIFITDDRCAVISIVVDREYFDKKKAAHGYANRYFYTRFIASKTIKDLIAKYQNYYLEGTPKEKLTYISDFIIRELIIEGLSSEEDNRRKKTQHSPRIKQSLVYMFEHSSDPELTIEAVAKESGYSTAYFTKAFKAFMDDTPINHLNKIRLSEAKHLFEDKSLSLSEIAHRVGFKNTSTFTEAFRRIIGMNPKDYRKTYCN